MHCSQPFPHATKRLAIGMMLLSILGTAGCMIWHQATGGAAVDRRAGRATAVGAVARTTDPTIDQANEAADKCEVFACEP